MRASGFVQLALVPVLLQVYMSPCLRAGDCPRGPSHEGLSCVNDFNSSITCEWNGPQGRTPCRLHTFRRLKAFRLPGGRSPKRKHFYNASCSLEPVDPLRPSLSRCSLILSNTYAFRSTDEQEIRLTCQPANHSLSFTYTPSCHVKLWPPEEPEVNSTTVTWSVGLSESYRIKQYSLHLQWKLEAQSWKDASERNKTKDRCDPVCQIELDPDLLEQGGRYEARIRVQSGEDWTSSVWSEWSPTATWVSAVGRAKAPARPNIFEWDALMGSVVGGVLLLSLAIVLCKRDKTLRVCMLKKLMGPPLPNPGLFLLHDGNFQAWLTPQFINDSYFLRPVDVCSVEVTGATEPLVAQDSEAAPPGRRIRDSSCQSTSSRSCDPVRLPLCPPPLCPPPLCPPPLCPPPLSFSTEGNLKPCATDSPYGPIGGPTAAVKDREEEEEQGGAVEGLKSFPCVGMKRGSVRESLDRDWVEKIRAQWCELRSSDSGMGCSETEQVSEKSVEEADGTDSSRGHSEQSQEEGREKEDGKETETSQLFGGISSQGSIQVCSDYERVERVRAPCPEVQSAGSSPSGQCEEQVSQEGQEGGDSYARSPADSYPPSSIPQDSLCPFSSRLFNLTWPETDSQPGPLKGHVSERVSRILLTSSIEPSGGGYMPVGEAQN